MSAAPKDQLTKFYDEMIAYFNVANAQLNDNFFLKLLITTDENTNTNTNTAAAAAFRNGPTDFASLMVKWRTTVYANLAAELKKNENYQKHLFAIDIINNNGQNVLKTVTQEKQLNLAKHILALGVMCELTKSITFFQKAKIEGDANMGQLEAVLATLKLTSLDY